MSKQTTKMNTKPLIVKIAVKMEPEPPQLIEFNQNVDLSIIIEDLCCGWGIIDADQYALKFENEEIYVTQQNRSEIKNGTVLILTCSPTKMAREIIQALKSFSDGTMDRSRKKIFNLQNLSEISVDKTFSIAFINEKGLISLIDFIEKSKYQGPIMLYYALDSFNKIMRHGIVPWDILGTPFIIMIANFVSNSKIQDMKIIQSSLSILESLVLSCNDKYVLIEKAVGFPKRLMQRLENENLKLNVLSFINALFLKAYPDAQKSIAKSLFCKDNRYIFQNIIQLSEVNQEIAHQLYVTQTLYLNLLTERMNTPTDPLDQNFNNKLKELSKIEFELDTIGGVDPYGRHFGPFVIDCRLGFTDEENPALDFRSTPPGMLAIDCIAYFAENYKEDYAKVVLENFCRTDKRGCPIGRSSVEIVRVLCLQFKIGKPLSEHKTKYFQLFFSHEHPFYELYRVCITYTSKIWREMKATVDDFDKVLNIAMTQVNFAMNSKPEPANFEKLSLKLSTQTYAELNNQWRLEIIDKEKRASRLQAEEKLVETIKPELIQLIKEQRLNYMVEGARFIKIDQEGQEKYLFVKLSKNHKFLQYGDCDDVNIPAKEELKNILRVLEIKSLNTAKDHLLIARGRKYQFLFSLNIESKDEPFYLVALNEKSYEYWIDGINALMGNEVTSKEAESDLDRLLTMEIKLRTLEMD